MDKNNEDIESIPLKNLPDSGLTVFKYHEWQEGQEPHPDNVLIGLIGELERVAIVGYDKEGQLRCASSSNDIGQVMEDLYAFKTLLDEYLFQE